VSDNSGSDQTSHAEQAEQPAKSTVLAEVDQEAVKAAAEGLKANVQSPPINVGNEQLGTLPSPITPARGR
jgi:hypothetical protein